MSIFALETVYIIKKLMSIFGTTISVNSLKTSIFKNTQNLKRIINE